MKWMYNDGGRTDAGFRGDAGDCVTRAVAIATRQDYRTVYDELARRMAAKDRPKSARNGIPRKVYEPYLFDLGWIWTATMRIGSGCKVHLRNGEIPSEGPLIVRLSGHLSAVIDGIVHDTYDPSRDGTRCVYGMFMPGLNA